MKIRRTPAAAASDLDIRVELLECPDGVDEDDLECVITTLTNGIGISVSLRDRLLSTEEAKQLKYKASMMYEYDDES